MKVISTQVLNLTTLFSGKVIGAGSEERSATLDLRELSGYGSLMLLISGDGTLSVEIEFSNDGSNFATAEGANAIAAALTKLSGPNADGIVLLDLSESLIAAGFAKLLLTETGAASSVTVTAIVGLQ